MDKPYELSKNYMLPDGGLLTVTVTSDSPVSEAEYPIFERQAERLGALRLD